MNPADLSESLIEQAAEAGYRTAVFSAGYDPDGEHAWGKQTEQVRMAWKRVVYVVVATINEKGGGS